jgi:hypothetical protein
MPVLEASALETDPEGIEFLRGVLRVGRSPSAKSVHSPDLLERFSVQSSLRPTAEPSVAFALPGIGAEHEALAEL